MVVLAGSAGALQVLVPLLQGLTEPTAASLFVVYHRQANPDFRLADFVPGCPLAVREAADGQRVEPNTVHHPQGAQDLLVEGGRLVVAAPTRRHHPNIDLLLGSLAREYGPRVLAILLSGMAADGLEGLRAVQQAGGRTVVQDPAEARFPDLPAAAVQGGLADRVADSAGLRSLLAAELAAAGP